MQLCTSCSLTSAELSPPVGHAAPKVACCAVCVVCKESTLLTPVFGTTVPPRSCSAGQLLGQPVPSPHNSFQVRSFALPSLHFGRPSSLGWFSVPPFAEHMLCLVSRLKGFYHSLSCRVQAGSIWKACKRSQQSRSNYNQGAGHRTPARALRVKIRRC